MASRIGTFIESRKFELVSLFLVLAISALAHGVNMFNFPYYENDEGVYMSQAWSLVTMGKLAPYTYWYDHAPFGWMMISLWTILTGGFFTFGYSINTGRVFMLVVHLISCVLLYYIAKKQTSSRLAGLATILFFSLSPLGIYFQRRVLLDNTMIMWALVSLLFLLHYNNRLSYMLYSAIALALAVLTKENAIFFIPLYFYIVFSTSHKKHRNFVVTQWLLIIFSIISLYFVYSFLKGEFFPAFTFLGGNVDHVSLLETLRYQASRKGGSIFDTQNSLFWQYMRTWAKEDSLLIYGGVIATFVSLAIGVRNKNARIVSLLSLSMLFFLMRGGVVIEFYIIPLIPLFSLNISYTLFAISKFISYHLKVESVYHALFATITICFSLLLFVKTGSVKGNLNLFTSNQTKPQKDAVEWIKKYRSTDEIIIIDNYAYLDLREDPEHAYNNADWYWKVDADKDIFEKKLHNNPDNIDYIAATPQMEFDVKTNGLAMVGKVLGTSRPVTQFYNDGWGVTIWGNNSPRRILKSSWLSFVRNFIREGRVIDPAETITTSEGQAYALLRAVWMNDKSTFDSVHAWTQQHLVREDNLLQWRYSSEESKLNDPGSATDADQDYAIALLFASKQWKDESYTEEAKKVITEIWNSEVASINTSNGSRPYLLAGPWANTENELIVNPSYLSPAYYRIFSSVDPEHPWADVVATSYDVLKKCTDSKLDTVRGGLPPEWCSVKKNDLSVTAPSQNGLSTEYGYNAFRTPLRVMIDYRWNHAPEALDYLNSLTALSDKWKQDKKLVAVYKHDGTPLQSYETVAAYSGALGYFLATDRKSAKVMYDTKIFGKYYEDQNNAYWDDPNNYYTQNMGWFGTALYSNMLPNLWTK